jgi:hypothetical protein
LWNELNKLWWGKKREKIKKETHETHQALIKILLIYISSKSQQKKNSMQKESHW